jgi:hypothetical protein
MLRGVQRTQQPTIDGSGKGDGRPGKESHDSGWQRLATGDGGRQKKCRKSATRVAGGEEGDGGKSDGDGKKGGWQATAMATATKRVMVRAARVADKEGYVQGGESDGDGDVEDNSDGNSNDDGDGEGTGDGDGDGEGVKSGGDGEEEGKDDDDGDN